jgi:type II secretory pathway component PulF
MGFKIENIKLDREHIQSDEIQKLLKKDINFFRARFGAKKKEAFYTELAVLLGAGINLKNALLLIDEEKSGKQGSSIISSLVDSLVRGKSFSEALKDYNQFTEYEFTSVKIGEETGTLIKVASELGLFYQRRNEQRKNIMNAMSYPIIVMATALISVLFMLRYVVPMFAEIFKHNNVKLPFLTEIIISASIAIEKYFIWFLLAVVILYFIIHKLKELQEYRRISSMILLKIPFFGELIRKMYLAQFTQALALLSSAKIPILQSIQLTKMMIDFYPLKQALEGIETMILNGKSLSDSAAPFSLFDRKMVSLLKVAEETNKSEFVFERLANQYNNDVQYQSKILSTILEPIIILVLGALVAIILVAMYLPMFKLSTVIG